MRESVKFEKKLALYKKLGFDAVQFQTENDAVMERVDEQRNVLGFSLLHVSRIEKQKPLIAQLA